MEQAKVRIVLRALIIALACTFVLGLVLEFVGDGLLPETLRGWDAGEEEIPEGPFQALAALLGLGVAFIALIGSYVTALLGLFFFRKWAAYLLLAVSVLSSFLFLLGPTVEPGITSLVSHADSVLLGAVLAICFLSDALEPAARP